MSQALYNDAWEELGYLVADLWLHAYSPRYNETQRKEIMYWANELEDHLYKLVKIEFGKVDQGFIAAKENIDKSVKDLRYKIKNIQEISNTVKNITEFAKSIDQLLGTLTGIIKL